MNKKSDDDVVNLLTALTICPFIGLLVLGVGLLVSSDFQKIMGVTLVASVLSIPVLQWIASKVA